LRKILFSLFFFAPAALAQEFDLSRMPKDYSFVSIEEEGRLALVFVRRDGAEYVFEQTLTYFDGRIDRAVIRVNNASQTTFVAFGDEKSTFTPHDCAPSIGTCYYVWNDIDGAMNIKTETRLVGDIRIKDEYSRDGEDWLFWNRECTIFDEYGFWIDYVRTYWNGETEAGYRERSTPDRISELWRICDPAAAVS